MLSDTSRDTRCARARLYGLSLGPHLGCAWARRQPLGPSAGPTFRSPTLFFPSPRPPIHKWRSNSAKAGQRHVSVPIRNRAAWHCSPRTGRSGVRSPSGLFAERGVAWPGSEMRLAGIDEQGAVGNLEQEYEITECCAREPISPAASVCRARWPDAKHGEVGRAAAETDALAPVCQPKQTQRLMPRRMFRIYISPSVLHNRCQLRQAQTRSHRYRSALTRHSKQHLSDRPCIPLHARSTTRLPTSALGP